MYKVLQTLKEHDLVVTPQVYSDDKVPTFVKEEYASGSGVVQYIPESEKTSTTKTKVKSKRGKRNRKRQRI